MRRRYRFQYSVLEYIHKIKGLTLLYLTEFLWGVRSKNSVSSDTGKNRRNPFLQLCEGKRCGVKTASISSPGDSTCREIPFGDGLMYVDVNMLICYQWIHKCSYNVFNVVSLYIPE